MTMGKQKLLCEENLRHAEYYGMLGTFDSLYAQSKEGREFIDLMSLMLKRENILLAYRNIKANTGSKTAGTDKLTIGDIGKLSPDEVVQKVRYIVQGTEHGYRPKPVRRKDIPKPYDPTKTRPLGIPCIWDRLIQQCIRQIMEPICEAKFSEYSYGFRPNRSAEHAIAAMEKHMQLSKLHYVIEFDIKGFFDNVNHSKLIRQIWALGIHDKQLLFVLRRILSAPIRLENGQMAWPTKGTPQGGIISPLLANIVLNELDHWIESQWVDNPAVNHYRPYVCKSGSVNRGNGIRMVRETTRLKEMYIVRYADDFIIMFQYENEAQKVYNALIKKLAKYGLELEINKTRIIPFGRYKGTQETFNFLGFMHYNGTTKTGKYTVGHKMDKKKRKAKCSSITKWIKERKICKFKDTIKLLNLKLIGIYAYYGINGMYEELCKIYYHALYALRTMIFRRSQRKISKEIFYRILARIPIVRPRIYKDIWCWNN